VASNAIVNYKEKHGLENDVGFHVGSNVVFVNREPNANDKVIVLFGDSFAEYRPHLLTGMLAETFRELHFVWSISIDWNYVKRVKPDIVVSEATERFMTTLPDDGFDVDDVTLRKLAPLINRPPKS
jgi:hypothetical protein